MRHGYFYFALLCFHNAQKYFQTPSTTDLMLLLNVCFFHLNALVTTTLLQSFELLVTKQLRFQFKNHNNVRVEELKNQDEIAQLLSEMFPKFQNDPCRNVHLFIDEASKDHMNPIHTLLSNLPKDSANYIWIVDSDNFISHISEKYL